MTFKPFLLISFLSITAFASVQSQTSNFGKISDETWGITTCSFDTAADALVLFNAAIITIRTREGEVNTDQYCKLQPKFFIMVYERHKRVKIVNKGGRKAGNISFTLHSVDGKKDDLTHFKALAVHKENGKEISEKFGLKNLKKVVNADESTNVSFELPETPDGSIVDLAYTIETPLRDATPEWNFADEFPTLYSEVKYLIPAYFQWQKKCVLMDKLAFESFLKPDKYEVSFTSSTNGTTSNIYTFFIKNDIYSATNLPALPKTEDAYKLNYQITAFNFASVPYTTRRVANNKRGSTSLGGR